MNIFGRSGFENILDELDWHIDEEGFIQDSNDEEVKCSICGVPLKKDTLSAFFGEEVNVVCDNIECILRAREKLKPEDGGEE
ncbi:hypothetical protein AKJ56_00375 [candidate division MSBL1 archaeon SCGC-AAA382N08]|uniref:Uncharacterized protein n=1 Tax=candidate division MSBL1 archaeon SCGC-AAA382N08 TaxID=1698285 RepID=A0A133VQM8_9EURY|nr:hypothetical protein AKJ56_00375 [candidate division MSBL1 archaeon SCGC-AAA382N08]